MNKNQPSLQIKAKRKTKIYLHIANFPFMLAASFFILHFTNHPAAKKIIQQFFTPQDLSKTQGQIDFIASIALYLAILIFSLAFMISIIRIFLLKSPVPGGDPGFIGIVNRIIQNNIQQSFIFFPIYLYTLRNNGFGLNNDQLMIVGSWFIIGRAFYAFGYFLGYLSGIESFRVCGFAITVASYIVLIFQIIEFPVLKYICM